MSGLTNHQKKQVRTEYRNWISHRFKMLVRNHKSMKETTDLSSLSEVQSLMMEENKKEQDKLCELATRHLKDMSNEEYLNNLATYWTRADIAFLTEELEHLHQHLTTMEHPHNDEQKCAWASEKNIVAAREMTRQVNRMRDQIEVIVKFYEFK